MISNKMKKLFSVSSVLLLVLAIVSCKEKAEESIYSGFERMENGSYMKFYSKGNSEIKPSLNDLVTFEMSQYFEDSLLITTAGYAPMSRIVSEDDFEGDLMDGLMMMHVGDSARLVVLADSVFAAMYPDKEIPLEYAGKPFYYDLKLLSVTPFEVWDAERRALLDSLMREEDAFLKPLLNDKKNTVTESGIIVMEKKGKGRLAQLGEYLDFDFTMCSPVGDTIMNSFGMESVILQYGEEFLGQGFNEAFGMVPEGGVMRFVLPSSLAFDSLGLESYVMPYTPLVVLLRMNNVLEDKDALAQHLEDKRNTMIAKEAKSLSDYIKKHGIKESPTQTGLYIIRQEEGDGKLAQIGDEVAVHCVLKNLEDEVLDSSYDYDRPLSFTIGREETMPAIEEAVMTMKQGAKVTLITPSELAFGDLDLGVKLPPYSPLRIELELVEIK